MAALPLRKFPGVGPRTAEKLESLGLKQGSDLLNWSLEALTDAFGKFGHSLHQRARGIDNRPVQPSRERKSVGVETTLARDLVTSGQCRDVLESLLPELRKRLRGRAFKSVTVKLKFHDFQQTTAAGQAVQLRSDILDAVLNTAYARAAGRRVRLVGISVTLDETPPSEQLSLGF